MSNVVDMQAYKASKPERKRRHGDPLFAEGINTRIPIVNHAVLRTLNSIASDDKLAAKDAEDSFKTPEQLAAENTAENVRWLARPALADTPAPADAPPLAPPPFAAETTPQPDAEIIDIEAARQRIIALHATDADQASEQRRESTNAEVIALADRRAQQAQTREEASRQADEELENWFKGAGWQKDPTPGDMTSQEEIRHAA